MERELVVLARHRARRVGVGSFRRRFGDLRVGGTYRALVGSGPGAWAVLFVGGALVGFGTRMAAGCTSGHGLVGCGSFRPGSLVATACFFGTGIAVSFILAWVAR